MEQFDTLQSCHIEHMHEAVWFNFSIRQFFPNLPYVMIMHAWAYIYHMHKFSLFVPYCNAFFIDTIFFLLCIQIGVMFS